MWFAILITILAAAGNNIGKVLQKQATRTLPRLVLTKPTVLLYLRSGTWVTGMLTDLGGALLMIVAFAYAPVSVVQPVSAVGLVILMVFSHFYLKERLAPHEWAAAGVAFAGVLGLGASAEPQHAEHPAHLGAGRVLGAFGAMLLLLGAECWWRHGRQPHGGHGTVGSGGGAKGHAPPRVGAAPPPHSHAMVPLPGGHGGGGAGPGGGGGPAADAVLCGLEAGACFGLSAAACRTGFILAAKLSVIWVPLGLAASVCLTSSGFLLQTRGLKAGNTVSVCVAAATSSMLCGVAAGMVALDEQLPSGHGAKAVRLASWCCILVGVSALAGGWEALGQAAAWAMTLAPAWLVRALPRPLAVGLHRAAKRRRAGSGAEEVSQEDGVV